MIDAGGAAPHRILRQWGARFTTLRARAARILDARAGPATVLIVTLLTAALYLWRSGDARIHPQLIAEDGAVFFTEARTLGLRSVGYPYAGYLHALPRIVALAAELFPAPQAPRLYLTAATALVGWSAATIAATNRRGAWLLAPLAMLVPVGGEVFGTLANIQWLLQPALVLVIATETPDGAFSRWNQRLFALAASITGPFSIFVAPLAVLRIARWRRDAQAWILGVIVVAGAVVQLSHALPEPSPYEGVREPLHLAVTMLDRWIGEASHAGRTVRPVQWRDALGLAVLVAIAATAVCRLAAGLLLYAVLALAATFVRFLPDSRFFDVAWWGERYYYMPRLALLWILALALVRLRWMSFAGLAGLALMLSAQSEWQKPPAPRLPWDGPAAAIDRGEPVRIVINPSRLGDTSFDAWTVNLPGQQPP